MLDSMSDSGQYGMMSGVDASLPVLNQRTLKNTIHCNGVGLHSGHKIALALKPAAPDTGIVFHRTDVEGDAGVIPARYDTVTDTRLCTKISNAHDISVGTVEHLMAAIAGCGIDNLIVELNGPEVPVMDGSSEPFVFLIDCAGIEDQHAPRRAVVVKKTVSVDNNGCTATLSPSNEFTISMGIDFPSKAIGRQELFLEVSSDNFKHEICRARTFGFVQEVEALREMGLARGASLDNAVGIAGDTIMNEEGLRYEDECVRHKVLDCIGDLALAGAPLVGHYRGFKAGHAINNALLRELFASDDNWELVEVEKLQGLQVELAATA